jgi:hypothetical protein
MTETDPTWFQKYLEWFRVWAWAALALGLPALSLRYYFKLDLPMARDLKLVRYGIVVFCWLLASLPGRGFLVIRDVSAAIGLAVFLWPNLLAHVARFARKHDSTAA